MQDYYKILGVERTADAATIKRAYRQKASLYHPDKEGGSKTKFQEVEEAYRTLSDPQKRQQYDNPSPFGQGGFQGFGHHESPFDIDAIFSMFGTRFHHHSNHPFPQRAQMALWITLADVARGGSRTVSVGTNRGNQTVEVEIPKGINDGDTVQYGGLAPGGGDLIVTFRIHPDPKFQRQGYNLIVEHPVSIWDLIIGGETIVRDILGNNLTITIPPNTQPGTVMRLRNRGLQSRSNVVGDLLVKIQAQIPEKISDELIELIKQNRNQ